MDQNLGELLKKEEGRLSRREFIQRSAILTGSLTAAATITDSFGSSKAYAAQVDPNDPGLASSDVKFNSTDGDSIGGYLTRPKGDERRPAVVVIHENRGLNDHIRDVARRLAKAGYAALAPDLLSRQGGTRSFASPEAAGGGINKLDEETIVKDLTGAVNYLKEQSFVRPNKIGVTGFCWGGGNALLFTTRNKDLAAAVIYYGRSPRNLEDVKNITAPVLEHYGALDQSITPQQPKLEEAMKKHGKSFEYHIYPEAPHAFNNDTNPDRYRPDAAKEAWDRTLDFFKKHLQS